MMENPKLKGAMKICRIAILPKIHSVESPLLPKIHSVSPTPTPTPVWLAPQG